MVVEDEWKTRSSCNPRGSSCSFSACADARWSEPRCPWGRTRWSPGRCSPWESGWCGSCTRWCTRGERFRRRFRCRRLRCRRPRPGATPHRPRAPPHPRPHPRRPGATPAAPADDTSNGSSSWFSGWFGPLDATPAPQSAIPSSDATSRLHPASPFALEGEDRSPRRGSIADAAFAPAPRCLPRRTRAPRTRRVVVARGKRNAPRAANANANVSARGRRTVDRLRTIPGRETRRGTRFRRGTRLRRTERRGTLHLRRQGRTRRRRSRRRRRVRPRRHHPRPRTRRSGQTPGVGPGGRRARLPGVVGGDVVGFREGTGSGGGGHADARGFVVGGDRITERRRARGGDRPRGTS